MLVSEESRRSRPVVLYGILAKSALNQLENLRVDTDRSAYFENLIRLLELYRLDVLNRHAPRAVLDRKPADSRMVRRKMSEADAVRHAIDQAHQIAYPNLNKAEVVDYLKSAFLKLSQQKISEIPFGDLEKLKRFLTELMVALKSP